MPRTTRSGPTDFNEAMDIDWAELIPTMRRQRALWAEIDDACADWAGELAGKTVADLGCGTGGMTVALAARAGAAGRTYAIDGTPQMLEETLAHAKERGVDATLSTLTADIESSADVQHLRESLPPLDLLWASGVVHHFADQLAGLRMCRDLLGPGGTILLAEGGLRATALPWDVGVGRPGLEARLHAAEAEWFVDLRADLPDVVRTPFGWRAMLSRGGFVGIETRSFLLEVPAPDEEVRADLAGAYRHRVSRAGDRLSAEDQAAWERLLEPDGRTYLADRDDLHYLAVRSVHRATI